MMTVKTIGAALGVVCLALSTGPAAAGPFATPMATMSSDAAATSQVIRTGARVSRGGSLGLGLGIGLGLNTGKKGHGHHGKKGGSNIGVGANVGANVGLGHGTGLNVGVGIGTGIKLGGSHRKHRGRW